MKSIKVDFSKCSVKCEGLDVLSYNEFIIDSKMTRSLSKLYKRFYHIKFDKNPILTKYLSKLSDQYSIINIKKHTIFQQSIKVGLIQNKAQWPIDA